MDNRLSLRFTGRRLFGSSRRLVLVWSPFLQLVGWRTAGMTLSRRGTPPIREPQRQTRPLCCAACPSAELPASEPSAAAAPPPPGDPACPAEGLLAAAVPTDGVHSAAAAPGRLRYVPARPGGVPGASGGGAPRWCACGPADSHAGDEADVAAGWTPPPPPPPSLRQVASALLGTAACGAPPPPLWCMRATATCATARARGRAARAAGSPSP